MVWPLPAAKNHTIALLPVPPLEAKLVGQEKDSLTEKEANSNNNNTDKKNIQKQGNTQSNSLPAQCPARSQQ